MGISSLLSTFPVINSVAMLVLFILGPALPFLLGVYIVSRTNHWRGGRLKVFFCNCACLLNKYAPIIAFGNIFWAFIIALAQMSFIYHKLSFSNEVTYYTKVDLPQYDSLTIINQAMQYNSLNVLQSSIPAPTSRRLTSGEKQALSIIYHTGDWDNMLTESLLVKICETERNIRENVDCIDFRNFKSMIPSVFNATTCEYYTSYNQSISGFGNADNSLYVADNTPYQEPVSDILMSYFTMGECGDTAPANFEDSLRACEVGEVQTTFVSSKYATDEFIVYTRDAQYWSAMALVICIAFLVLGVKGFIVALTTLYCIVIAFINAAAILPFWDYTSFSVFNVLSVFILLGVGANAVLLYGSAWRRVIRPGTHATVAQIIESYSSVSQSILFTTCVALLSLFSKLASPVIVISQLGAFMGISVLVFYLLFHYIVIPMWIFTSWFPLPIRFHRWVFKRRVQLCGNLCGDIEEPDEEQGAMYTTAAIAEDAGDDEGSEDEANVIPIENVRYDNWINPNAPAAAVATTSDAEATDGESPVEESPSRSKSWFGSVFGSSGATTPVSDAAPVNATSAASAAEATSSSTALVTTTPEPEILAASPVMVSGGGGSRASVAEGEVEEAPQEPAEPEVVELAVDTSCCRGKRPLKFLGFFVFLVTLGALGVVYYFVSVKIDFDFGIPQLFEPTSNLGQAMYVSKYYKSSLFTLEDSMVNSLANEAPSFMPTELPTQNPALVPSRSPTRAPTRPTATPTRMPSNPTFLPSETPSFNSQNPSATPSMSPSTHTPSMMTHSPSSSLLPTSVVGKHFDYSVTGCWGIYSHKDSLDSDYDLSFNKKQFTNYMDGDYNPETDFYDDSALLQDMNALCGYVNSNRDALNVHPDWDRGNDCVYDQLKAAANDSYWYEPGAEKRTMNNLLIFWGSQSYSAGNNLGMVNNSTRNAVIVPGWICTNISLRSYGVSSFLHESHLALDLNDLWQTAFHTYGAASANAQGVPIIAGSQEFSFPMLADEVVWSLKVSAMVSIIGFIGLLWLFTVSDFGLTLLGSLGMFTIICVTVCLHTYFCAGEFDLLDIVVLVAIMGLVVDFPIHLIVEYIYARFDQDERQTMTIDKHLSPALASTNRYIRVVLIPPLILIVLCGIPLLYARFQLIQKFGEYIIILAIVSYVFTLCFLPYLMALGCRTKFCEELCYDEDDYDFGNPDEPQEIAARPPPVVREEPTLTRQPTHQNLTRGGSRYIDTNDYGGEDDTQARERELVRLATEQSMQDAPPQALQQRTLPPRQPSQYVASSNGSTRGGGGDVAEERERELVRMATQQSLLTAGPSPHLMQRSPSQYRSVDTAQRENELVRMATQQSMMDAAPQQQPYPPMRPMPSPHNGYQQQQHSPPQQLPSREELMRRAAVRQASMQPRPGGQSFYAPGPPSPPQYNGPPGPQYNGPPGPQYQQVMPPQYPGGYPPQQPGPYGYPPQQPMPPPQQRYGYGQPQPAPYDPRYARPIPGPRYIDQDGTSVGAGSSNSGRYRQTRQEDDDRSQYSSNSGRY